MSVAEKLYIWITIEKLLWIPDKYFYTWNILACDLEDKVNDVLSDRESVMPRSIEDENTQPFFLISPLRVEGVGCIKKDFLAA